MIEFTIKTIESNNHQFSVEDETTVAQLKEQIREEMGIAIDMQRLIFCGRVLPDDRRLSEFNVNGKVIHLVPRPPPSPQSRNNSANSPNNSRQELRVALDEAQRVIDSMSNQNANAGNHIGQGMRRQIWSPFPDPPSELVMDQHQAQMMTPTANRMDFVRRTIDVISHSLSSLQNMLNDITGDAVRSPAEPMDTDSSSPSDQSSTKTPPTETTGTRTERNARLSSVMGGDGLPPRNGRSPGPSRPILTRPRDLANLMEELDVLHAQFTPYRVHYLHILRDANISEVPTAQRTLRRNYIELVCDVMHSFAHAYHSLSDISLDIDGSFPRVTSGFSSMRHSSPIQPHINLVQSNRRPADGRPVDVRTVAPYRPPTMHQVIIAPHLRPDATPRAPAPATAAPEQATGANTGANTGTTATHPPVNPTTGTSTNTQAGYNNPEPIAYHFEIETRVPMGFDAELLNGIATVATNIQQGLAQYHQNRAASQGPGRDQPVTEDQGLAQNQYQAYPQSQEQSGQGNLPRIPLDLLNGLATVAANLQQGIIQYQQNRAASQGPGRDRPVTEDQGQAQNQYQAQPQSQEQSGQGNRPTVPMDMDHLLRTLRQAHPGVEVVMTMEEIDPPGSPQPGTDPNVRLDNPGGVNAGTATGVNSTTAGAGIGVGPGAGFPSSGFTGTESQYGNFQIPVIDGVPQIGRAFRFDFNVNGNGTFSQGASGLNSGNFSMPDGVFMGPMQAGDPVNNPNEFLQVLSSIFRQEMNTAANNRTINTTTTNTATSNTGTTTNNTGTPSTTTSNNATSTVTSANITPITDATAVTVTSNPLSADVVTLDNGSGRSSDGAWGMELGQPNVIHFETVTPTAGPAAPQVGQNRLGPLSAMARARTLQQAEQRRRNANPNAGTGPDRHRQSNARAHHLALACMVYDRFLSCDSLHARNRLTQNRALYQNLHNEQIQERRARHSAPDIDLLREQNANFTTRHMAIMMRLLSGPVSVEGRFNAFMVTVARTLYMTRTHEDLPSQLDSMRIPREYRFVRMQMREYIQRLVESARVHNNGGRRAMDVVANLILAHNAPFLERMSNYTSIVPNSASISALRNFLEERMPCIIACVLSDSTSEMTTSSFYSVFARFYTDICALVMGFCTEGFEGLRALYTAFIEEATESFETSAREWIRLISRENLVAIQGTIDYQTPNDSSNFSSESSESTDRPSDRQTTPPLVLPPLRYETPETLNTAESTPWLLNNTTNWPTEMEDTPLTENESEPESEETSNEETAASPPLAEDVESAANTAITTSRSLTPSRSSPEEARSEVTLSRQESPISAPHNDQGDQDGAQALPQCDRSQTSSSRNSPDSTRFMPPVTVIENWGEEWVPVFTRDQRAQRERDRPQEPYSDAYLSGMPSRKRRCIRASRPSNTLDGFTNESVRSATDRAAWLNPSQVRGVVRDSVRSLVRTRANTSEDFDPVRYSAAARLL